MRLKKPQTRSILEVIRQMFCQVEVLAGLYFKNEKRDGSARKQLINKCCGGFLYHAVNTVERRDLCTQKLGTGN